MVMGNEIGMGTWTVMKNHVAGFTSAAPEFDAQPPVKGLHTCPTTQNMKNWLHTFTLYSLLCTFCLTAGAQAVGI